MKEVANQTKPVSNHVTIEDIRKVKGYENLSDAEAQKLLRVLRQYCSLLTDFFTKQKSK